MQDWLARAYGHSPRQHDYSLTVAVRVVNWAVNARKLRQHHLSDLDRLYEVDRADIVWTPAWREQFNAVAPRWIQRILDVACETGLRPSELCRLSRQHVQETPEGWRIRIRTDKRRRIAVPPVTEGLQALLDEIPRDRLLVLVGGRGQPLTAQAASKAVARWRDKAGLTEEAIGVSLRLQDARGTAATRFLEAGLTLNQIAAVMGWSLRHAAAVIEHYAAATVDESDTIRRRVEAHDGARTGTKSVNGGVNR